MLKSRGEIGFNSICDNGDHILLWDFDLGCNYLDLIYRELQRIQKQYSLSDIFLVNSRNGYNAICLDKLSLEEVFKIKSSTIYSDSLHNRIGKNRNGWVLRVGEDKTLLSCLEGSNNVEKSNAHRLILEKAFGIVVPRTEEFDDNTMVKVEAYIRQKGGSDEGVYKK